VLELDEQVALVGYTFDPKAEDQESGSTRTGRSREVAEGKAGMRNGLSGEAVRIMKKPGMPIR